MKPQIKSILAIIFGWLAGSIINMGLIQTGHSVFPIEGVDINDMEALASVMPTLGYEYFIFPFFAHAFGTLVGAFVAGLIAVKNKIKFSLVIGVLFLLGGIIMCCLLPGPIWFNVLDITIAFIPMAWLGGLMAIKFSRNK